MTLLDKSKEYFTAFSEKNIEKLNSMFSEDVSLRDWDIEATGIGSVLKANSNIFSSVETIVVIPTGLYCDREQNTVIAEIEILINGDEKILVNDVLEFNKEGKIKSIRAYKG